MSEDEYSPAYQDVYQQLWHESADECRRLRAQLDRAEMVVWLASDVLNWMPTGPGKSALKDAIATFRAA